MKNINKILHSLLLGVGLLSLSACDGYSKFPHIGKEVELLQFYKVKAEGIKIIDSITIIDKDGNESKREYNGYFFIDVKIGLSVNNSDDAKPYKLDANDFKIKNHIGTNLGSSSRFGDIDAFEDFAWCDKTISKGESLEFSIDFKFNKSIDLNKCLLVLEVDFSNAFGNSVDIILSENASELIEQ